MAEHVGHGSFEPGLIVHVFAIVVAEKLLIEVTEKMKRFDAHIRTVDTALQERPEVLKAVGVDTTIDILDGVIDNRMSVLSSQSWSVGLLLPRMISASSMRSVHSAGSRS